MAANITLSKGGTTVELQTDIVTQNFTNKLFTLTPPQTTANQSSGPRIPKVIDLLRITRQFIIKAFISPTSTKSSKSIKDDLISIYKGGGTNGGYITMTYGGDTIHGYMEKLSIIEKPMDEPSDYESSPSKYQDSYKYDLSITFVEGEQV